ncbi:penicillin-binding protein 1A [Effusibacillus dendaii]|uniref:Fibronectin type-III domain-containing protein n=1 Tax=Effusibacillus dendaii TaxID=2743772 RepID=A0A7I8DBN5_9BACL|nr:penicillin-binding protein 1A [Effusibacillus dendaii]BCJ85341.1 hypothetical protein skT53_03260 [Effusibacillus dendaii]
MGKKLIRSLILAAIIAGAIVLGVGCAVALPTLDPSKLEAPATVTKIYGINENEKPIELSAKQAEPVPYKQIPEYLKQAIIATEDREFYQHSGVNFKSMARALFRDILAGGAVEGGSTITQQLAKNTYLNQDKTIVRKLKEIALAAQIERQYTKDDILEMYLNKVNFHPSAVGVELAAKIYFGKSAKDLNLAEAAFLAGLPQAPSYYYDNLDEALKRRKIVLQNMVDQGYITQQQADDAAKQPVTKDYLKRDPSNFQFPHYVEYVLQEAEQKYQIPREQILRGGLNIYTNLDFNAQRQLEKQFSNPSNFPPNAKDGTQVQSAMVIVDPKTGGIRAMVGGRDTTSFMNFNRAFQMRRQPGSSFKPLVVYGPAVETGRYGPNSVLVDKPGTTFPGNPPYTPRDWDNHKQIPRGDTVTMREAVKWSFNIPAVWLLNEIGIDTGKQMAEKAGIPFDKSDTGLGIALGGLNVGVSPLQMADAYQPFDNGGKRIEAYAIRQIKTSKGDSLAQANPRSVQVMKDSTAATLTSLMQSVVQSGTGSLAQISGRQIAGKTGTTEYSDQIAGSNRDAWFVGYSPELVAAVWMGFDNSNGYYLQDSGSITSSGYPARLFSRVMTDVLKSYPSGSFATAPAEEPPKPDKKEISLTGAWNGKTVMLSWTALQGDIQYYVFRTEGSQQTEGALPIFKGNVTTFVDTDVQPGKTYSYAISAINLKDNKQAGESNALTIKTANDPDKSNDKNGVPPKDTGKPSKQEPGNGKTDPKNGKNSPGGSSSDNNPAGNGTPGTGQTPSVPPGQTNSDPGGNTTGTDNGGNGSILFTPTPSSGGLLPTTPSN